MFIYLQNTVLSIVRAFGSNDLREEAANYSPLLFPLQKIKKEKKEKDMKTRLSKILKVRDSIGNTSD